MENHKNLLKLAKMLDGKQLLETEDVKSAFADVINEFNRMRATFKELTQEQQDTLNLALKQLNAEHDRILKDVDKTSQMSKSDVTEQMAKYVEMCKKVRDEMVRMKPENGKDADEEYVIEEVLSRIELPEYKETILDTPEQVRDKLETLKDDKRLDKKHIKGLEKVVSNEDLDRAISILDQRSQYLINKTVKHDNTLTGAGTDSSPLSVVGGGGTTDHALLTNLDYASAGHTGFEPAKGADDNYVTDAQLIVIGNTSGTNTGDNATNTQYSGLAASKANVAGSLTQFVGNGNWKTFYSDGSGDVIELALGADGTFLKSNGASSAPTFSVPAGTGDVSKVGTPVNNQIGVWTGDGTIEGDSALTFDTGTDTLATVLITATTVTANLVGNVTGNASTVTTNANLTGPVTSTGNATAIANSINLPASPTTTTQSPGDNSTKIATTAYVQAAIFATQTIAACKYATTTDLLATYSNGASGVGATLTEVLLGALSVDGSTPSVGNRILVKNQTNTFENGIYTVTVVGDAGTSFVLTRSTDYNVAADINLGDTTFVSAGSTLANTTWTQNGTENPTMGTDAITFAQTAGPGSYTAGNGLTLTGTSFSINTAVTADLSTAQTFTNKTLTSPKINENVALTTTATKLNYLTSATGTTGTTSTNVVFSTSPTITTPTFATSITGSYLTASEILITDGSKNIVSAPVATYPSLTELTYLKGVTSAIQTQLDAKGAGTVTTVGFTGGLISVANATTTPALTVAGTSGGIPYFSSASTWATSAALAANAIVIGGGAGAAPATTTTGTGVLTALGVNVGSAGAFVTFNGALGTPSSGTVTNLTGTASININGTVGATTPSTGVFTTLVAGSTTSLLLGTAGSAVGNIGFRNATSGTITLAPVTGALGTVTLTLPAVTDTVQAIAAPQTVTNKRNQPRTASSTTSSNLSPDLSSANVYFRTTQTATLTIDAPTGTPVIGETIMIYVDSAGAQTLTINSTYKAFGAAFPATTTAGKTFMMSCQYNGTDWKTLWANAV